MKMRFLLLAMFALVLSVGAASCGGGDFDPSSVVNSVRVLAVKADQPFAAPGETVALEVLAVDGRKDQTRPMRTFWIPTVCNNPKDDLYYACFQSFLAGLSGAASSIGGGDAGPSALTGRDLSAFLVESPKFSFRVPDDLISSHPIVGGAPQPYGLSIGFYLACAGHPELVLPTGGSLQEPPLACFDEAGRKLDAEQFVFGFARVYAYEKARNQNPTFGAIRFDGKEVDLAAGITLGVCSEGKVEDCPKKKMVVEAPETSQEANPFDLDRDGKPLREQVWVSFFSTAGRFDSGLKLLYDSTSGKVTDEGNDIFGPNKPELPRSGRIYLVLHDSRGGVSWTDFPVQAQ